MTLIVCGCILVQKLDLETTDLWRTHRSLALESHTYLIRRTKSTVDISPVGIVNNETGCLFSICGSWRESRPFSMVHHTEHCTSRRMKRNWKSTSILFWIGLLCLEQSYLWCHALDHRLGLVPLAVIEISCPTSQASNYEERHETACWTYNIPS